MRIVDLDETREHCWLVCLKEWAGPLKGTDHRAAWWRRLREQGLRVKLALTDEGVVGGMIQYVPIAYSMAVGHDLYFVQRTWVHGYAEGPGNLQRRGMGKALLGAAEADVKCLGAKGLAAWGNTFPDWLPVDWLLRQGYREVERKGSRVLVWKPFTADATPPQWRVPRKTPGFEMEKVTVTAFFNPWCGDGCDAYQRMAEYAQQQEGVHFHTVDTSDAATLAEWGFNNAVFVNERQITGGFDQFRAVVEDELQRRRMK